MSDPFATRGLLSARLLCPLDFPGKDTKVGCHFLLQGIFPTQGLKQHLWYLCIGRWILYQWATREALLSSRVIKIKKTDNKCWWKCREIGLISTVNGNVKPLWKIISQFIKTLNIYLNYDPGSTFKYFSKRSESTSPYKDLYMNVQSSFVHSIPNQEKTKTAINRRMDKQTVLHPHDIILVSTDLYTNKMGASQNNYTKLKKPDKKNT